MSATSPAPALTGSVVLSLLTALPLPSPAAHELIAVHAPFSSTSVLPASALNKWLTRLNSAVAGREAAACAIAEQVVVQDVEGYATGQHGKSWMGACLGSLGSSTLPTDGISSFLGLTRALVDAAPYAPTFEREVVQPAMGKLAVTMGKLVERLVEAGDWNALNSVLETTRALILASPAPFRPATPTLRVPLSALVLRVPPNDHAPEGIRTAASETLALLYLCGGKAAAASAWGTDMKETLGGLAASIVALAVDAWEEEPPRTAPLGPPASLPAFSLDPIARANGALAAIEAYTENALALLRLKTARPVPIPLAQIVSTGVRLLNLTLDTPTASHISPAHHAALVSALPRLWRCGMLILASAATTVGGHLVPHLSCILEHSVFLLERVPATMTESRLNLVEFHNIIHEMYPAATLPVEYTSRLLRFSLGVMGTLLDSRPPPAAAPPTGRKNKKRARGAEDALVGSLEGRANRGTTKAEADIILALLDLTRQVHTAPLLSPALLTFSIRLHLSLQLSLRSRPALTSQAEIMNAIGDVLEAAAHLEAGGTARDVRTLLVALLPATSKRNAALNELLHPQLPPMARALPTLAQLHMFAPESDAERKLRHQLGFVLPGEERRSGDDSDSEDEDEDMVVDSAPAPQAVAVPAPVPVVNFAPLPLPLPLPLPAAQPIQLQLQPVQLQVQPVPVAVAVAPVAPGVAAVPAMPFMSVPSGKPATEAPAPAPVPVPTAAPADGESDDEPIPDLDSGSEDEDDDDE